MAFDKKKFIARFIEDAKEHIGHLNKGLLALEKNPREQEALDSVFRSAHTIKGSARMLKLLPLSETAHKIEDVLDALRREKTAYSAALADLLFQGIDAVDTMLDSLAAGEEPAEAPEALCSLLEKAAQGKLPDTPDAPDAPLPADMTETASSPPAREASPGTGEQKSPEPAKASSEAASPPARGTSYEAGEHTSPEPAKPSSETAQQEPVSPAPEPVPEKKDAGEVCRPASTLRVRSDKLDGLIKLMGEVVSGHSLSKQRFYEIQQIHHLMKRHLEGMMASEDLAVTPKMVQEAAGLLKRVARTASGYKEDLNAQWLQMSELRENALKMRMLPLSTIFDSFQRNIRNVARMSRKEIRFDVEGGETELDKKIIEKIGDSLLHMLRNSIDHGIESPDVRRESGKPAAGRIHLSAGYEGNHVMIRIRDDGAGISVDRVKAKALEMGIYNRDKLDHMTEAEIVRLIFHPGFTTQKLITDISGRGVGMDVVRKNIIEDLKGSIQIDPGPGKGACFSIRLPLTMSIVHVLFVRSSALTFAIPAGFIDEIIRASGSDLIRIIDKEAIRVREEIIPVGSLTEILRLPHPPGKENGKNIAKEGEERLIIILSVGNEKMGIAVDTLVDEEEVVIKPLPAHMKHARFVSGCIIADKNKIINVLHVPEMVSAAREIRAFSPAGPQTGEAAAARHVLVVDDSVTTREIEKRILESYGYLVTVAEDGMEGLEKAGDFLYDLVVTDVEMPNMNGFTLTEKLRDEEAYREIPIILVTSLDKDEDKKRGMLAGADAYIVKGDFEQNTLIETVQHLIG